MEFLNPQTGEFRKFINAKKRSGEETITQNKEEVLLNQSNPFLPYSSYFFCPFLSSYIGGL